MGNFSLPLFLLKKMGVGNSSGRLSGHGDAVTVVGYENGGATGKLDIGTLVLVPRVVESLNVSVATGVCLFEAVRQRKR